jgi:hypothetical protein
VDVKVLVEEDVLTEVLECEFGVEGRDVTAFEVEVEVAGMEWEDVAAALRRGWRGFEEARRGGAAVIAAGNEGEIISCFLRSVDVSCAG